MITKAFLELDADGGYIIGNFDTNETILQVPPQVILSLDLFDESIEDCYTVDSRIMSDLIIGLLGRKGLTPDQTFARKVQLVSEPGPCYDPGDFHFTIAGAKEEA